MSTQPIYLHKITGELNESYSSFNDWKKDILEECQLISEDVLAEKAVITFVRANGKHTVSEMPVQKYFEGKNFKIALK
jgi:hypothetical protein